VDFQSHSPSSSIVSGFIAGALCVSLGSTIGCGGGGGDGGGSPSASGSSPAPTPSTTTHNAIETVTFGSTSIAGGASAQFQVSVGSSALLLIADGGRARDLDIHTVVDPKGAILVTESRTDPNPIGRTLLQNAGDSVVAGLFPHTTTYAISSGRYTFRVANNDTSSRTVTVHAVINHRDNPQGGSLNANFFFCGISDLTAATALSHARFLVMLDEFKRIMQQAGIQISVVGAYDCPQSEQARLSVIATTDANGNGLQDEMEDLFSMSQSAAVSGVNIFIVQEISGSVGGFLIVGQPGGIPGPGPIKGTVQSGLAVALVANTIGALSQAALLSRGRTIAHEVGHYLGLFHTTEVPGANGDPDRVDPIPDTPECPTTRDLNNNGQVTADECLSFGGTNVMFWTQPASPAVRDQFSSDQIFVLRRNPLVQ
jgi:hypothetical protein